MINADQDADMWFQPKRIGHHVNAKYIDETLFVYGLYSPFHFSHYLYNGLMPLYSTIMEYGASSTLWTMRVLTHWNKHTKIDLVLPNSFGGKDIVFEDNDMLTSRQIKPGYKAMCFARAVVGGGNRCSLYYCENQIPSKHYASFKEFTFQHATLPNNTCLSSVVHYKKTGKYKIGILNRKHTRHITNVPELIERLSQQQQQQGDQYAIRTIDFDQDGCDMVHTANAVKDLDILIAPFGNGLGAGLFMKENAIVISISARWYSEDWFKYPMTAIGRRIFNYECDKASCQEFDEGLATEILKEYNVTLDKAEMQMFVSEKYPEMLKKHLPGKEWHPIYQYQKDVARRVDVDGFMPYLQRIIDTSPPKDAYYPDTCKKENVCCDLDCGGPLERNIFGKTPAW